MSTAVLPLKPRSLEEFLARPDREDGQYEELIEGELVVSPNVKAPHTEIVRRLYRFLLPLENTGFVVVTDFACVLGNGSMPNPDLGVVKRDIWNQALQQSWLQQAPNLTVEVASPGNRKLQQKLRFTLNMAPSKCGPFSLKRSRSPC